MRVVPWTADTPPSERWLRTPGPGGIIADIFEVQVRYLRRALFAARGVAPKERAPDYVGRFVAGGAKVPAVLSRA